MSLSAMIFGLIVRIERIEESRVITQGRARVR